MTSVTLKHIPTKYDGHRCPRTLKQKVVWLISHLQFIKAKERVRRKSEMQGQFIITGMSQVMKVNIELGVMVGSL